jgi:hypothetical protein
MKIKPWAAVPAAVFALCAVLAPHVSAQAVPAGLTGSLIANPTVVQAGQSPKLTWSINYPSVVKKYVDIEDPGEGGGGGGKITPLVPLYAEVRVIGQGVTVQTNNGFNFVDTEGTMSINSSSSFKRIFFGTNPEINPGAVVDLKSIFGSTYANNLIPAGRPLRFGGRYYYNSSYGTHYKSNDGSDNVRFLVSGDTPPSKVPDYNAPSLESFIRPYLDPSGKVKIGPMDVIIFMELTHSASQKSNVGYDLQDLVLLVTFRTK